MNVTKLVEAYRKAPAETSHALQESFKAKDVKAEDFSLKQLWEACFGYSTISDVVDRRKLAQEIMESAGAVSTAAFANISGQIVYSALLEGYESEEFVFTRLIPKVMTKFNGEKIAGISRIGDESLVVPEGQAFPLVGVSEDYIETPQTVKRGLIVPVTKEAIFFDRTGILLDRCREVGQAIGLSIEKRAIDCVIDENAGAVSAPLGGHRYHWKGTTYATYQASTPWSNLTSTNALVDWTDVEAAELKLAAIVDPYTGEPVMVRPTHLIVTPDLLHTARAIMGATENRLQVGGFATSGNLVTRISGNTLDSYTILSSRQLKARLGTDTSWFLGNPAKAFRRMVNWDLQTMQAPSTSLDEFQRDIVVQYRADERSAFTTFDPRFMHKSTA